MIIQNDDNDDNNTHDVEGCFYKSIYMYNII